MIVRGFLLCLFAACLCASRGWAEPAAEGGSPNVAAYEREISAAKDKNEEALLRKKLGDVYAEREDNSRAADEYGKAIQLAPSAFPDEQLVRMATVISWADRYGEAEGILRTILARSPENREARLQLARVLSWDSKLSEAGSEADILIAANADDQDALVAKGDVLRWSDKPAEAIPLYEKALSVSENFGARIGLANAYLSLGDVRSARSAAAAAKPAYPYQEKEVAKFNAAASDRQSSWIGMEYSHYRDSDDNITNRYGVWFGTRVRTWDTELGYRITDAHDPIRHEQADEIRLSTRGKIGTAGVRASAGIAETDSSDASFFIWQVNADKDLGWASVWAGLSHDLFTDTAQLIRNRIQRTTAAVSFTEKLRSSIILQEAFARSSYSDANSSNDLKLTVKRPVVLTTPRVTVGYQFRYWDFDKETHSGYFDPKQFMSHQLFASLAWEQGRWYATFDPYGGYQSFTRSSKNTHELYAGFAAAAGWRPKQLTSIEVNAEGGNYAGGAAAGYNYYLVGFRVIIGF